MSIIMTRILGFFLIFTLSLGTSSFAQDDLSAGKSLFKNNCASCHNKNMKDNLTGPALGGYETRWADYSQEELYQWIRNSQGMIKEGHPKAVEMWNELEANCDDGLPQLNRC